MQVFLVDFQETAPSPRVKTYPLVDFISSESEIQFASLNPSWKSTIAQTIVNGASQILKYSMNNSPMVLIRALGVPTQSTYYISNIKSGIIR